MSKLTEYIGSRFGNPHGVIGRIYCVIMDLYNDSRVKTILLYLAHVGVSHKSLFLPSSPKGLASRRKLVVLTGF